MKKTLSLKTQTLLISLASLMLLGFLITLAGLIYINSLKEMMVQDALSLAQSQGQHLLNEINSILRQQHIAQLSKLQDASGFKSHLELFVRSNQSIISARLLDAEGHVIVTHYQDNRKIVKMLDPNEQFVTLIGPVSPEKLELIIRSRPEEFAKVQLPIKHGEVAVGQLQYDVSKTAIYKDLFRTSRIISTRLIAMIVLLFAILALTFLLLWRVFTHQIALVHAKDKSDKMAYVGSLAAGLAHEIRNPLNAMNLNLEVVREELVDTQPDAPSRRVAIITAVQQEVVRLGQAVSDFMAYAAPDRLAPETLDLRDVLNQSISQLDAELAATSVRCDIDAPQPCLAKADAAGLRQVFSNILLNAIQAMNGLEKRMRVEMRRDNHHCRISFIDTGAGFTPDDLDKVFEPFYSTKADGTGFGLAIARRIVEAHGGTIRAENGAAGGACITVVLPLARS